MKTVKTFPAKFSGRCDADGCQINIGDRIGFTEGYERPVCRACLLEIDLGGIEKTSPACTDCFLIHAGPCW